ncbi:riboflavin synthase [Blastochloris viridis]|uniref:Riboflavin synthase n=1 Tax=Blastochloris viridis TaxID=1079 RepID=A0A0H5BD55_BLAVI|nr:riboflavin synthase [Blastochloris viridis]ALK09955.1 Riboflavin synthase [Blastochloris viridis]BAS00136.1 riboflavin synthase eubacterial/eukaryotic [Blastochloris viridis]CUU42618.1 Riboflavin synthase alpha chain [Blastochloris viridis]
MFTGIVTDIGEVVAVAERDNLRRLSVACRYPADSIALGASICHSGICMTVIEVAETAGRTVYAIDAAAETLKLTTAGGWQVGSRINLERSLKIGDELGGHIVTGHVDGLAEIVTRTDGADQATFVLRVPHQLARFIAAKGSVALDGTSLTVNEVSGDAFTVHIIPHTLAVTTWGTLTAGSRLNLEVDLMARYAARLAEAR